MLLTFINVFNSLASAATSSAISSSASASASSSDMVSSSISTKTNSSASQKTVTVTVAAKCSPTTTVTTTPTTTSTTPKKETLCVKCYDKIINTPDCRKCSTTCDDGTKYDSADKAGSSCPNVSAKDVPCPCKDEAGRVIPENYYKTGDVSNKIALIDNGNNLTN